MQPRLQKCGIKKVVVSCHIWKMVLAGPLFWPIMFLFLLCHDYQSSSNNIDNMHRSMFCLPRGMIETRTL